MLGYVRLNGAKNKCHNSFFDSCIQLNAIQILLIATETVLKLCKCMHLLTLIY